MLSLILIPTLKCNANCDYCFEDKDDVSLSTEALYPIFEKMADYMDENHMQRLTIFWQGGEVLTLSPQWFWTAHDIAREVSFKRNKYFSHKLQSNMIGYTEEWQPLIERMFGNRVSSSLDYPNVHRRLPRGGPAAYHDLWVRNVVQARASGMRVGVISIPNEETIRLGAQRFYSYLVHERGMKSFQINTPFPGGSPNVTKRGLPLDPVRLAGFLTELIDVWLEEGLHRGITMGPFNRVLNYFLYDIKALPCIWHANCTDDLLCIDPRGEVSLCDCWVASYPDFWFGNIFDAASVSELLKSPVRARIRERPAKLVERGACGACEYLTLCHGGCPIRAFSATRDLIATDPYCETYKAVFSHVEQKAARLAREGKMARASREKLRHAHLSEQ